MYQEGKKAMQMKMGSDFLIFAPDQLIWIFLTLNPFQLKVEKKGKIVNDLVDIDFEQTVMK